MTTPVRDWIINTLMETIQIGTYWSDKDTKDNHPFETLTGMTQKTLLQTWFKVTRVKKDVYLDYTQPGIDPRFTTCSSFLPIFATKVRQAGGIAKRRDYYSGLDVDINLKGFNLHLERGWTPAFLGYAVNGGPKPGDFFQLHNPKGTMTEHVGVILSIEGDRWSMVAGGAGGRSQMHDGVKRTGLEPRPHNLMGWLDVDVYFDGWSGASKGGAVYST